MKAILVIDMPSKCGECPLHYRKRQGIYRCELTKGNVELDSKPRWCHLMPLEAYDAVREELNKRIEHPERYAKR